MHNFFLHFVFSKEYKLINLHISLDITSTIYIAK
jgi:hypothetical protein